MPDTDQHQTFLINAPDQDHAWVTWFEKLDPCAESGNVLRYNLYRYERARASEAMLARYLVGPVFFQRNPIRNRNNGAEKNQLYFHVSDMDLGLPPQTVEEGVTTGDFRYVRPILNSHTEPLSPEGAS
jgi:hypothetical protein